MRRFNPRAVVAGLAESLGRCVRPMLEVKSALRRALSISRSADPWELSDVTLDDFSIVENTVGVEILIGVEKWIEVTRRGTALCTKTFAQSNFRPWTMPYDAVVSALSDVRSRMRVNHRHDEIEEDESPEEIRIELSVCSPPDREWPTVSLDLAIDGIPGWQWAEIDQEGPDLQIEIYSWDDTGDLNLPLDHVIRRLRDAKAALLGTADRPPVRRPVVPSIGRRPVELIGNAVSRAESAAVFFRQAPSGLAVYYGDRRFASLPRDTSPTLELEAPSDGGWELPLAAVMDTLRELLKRTGMEETDEQPRKDVVFCPRVVGSGTTVDEIRFRNGLRAKMREHDDEVRIDLGSRGSAGKPWRLPLPQAIATLRWALAMLRAAGPWSQTNISREDFGAETHRDGVDLLVAGENWGKVRSRDSEVQMEFVERADMRPWILPYEPVIAALESAEEMVLADPRTASGRVVADDESVGAEAETLRQWQSLPSDRSEQVLECYFRDEEGWVQWAEVNQDGPESQVEIYSWPGCRRFAFPIRQVIERLGEAKAMFPGDES